MYRAAVAHDPRLIKIAVARRLSSNMYSKKTFLSYCAAITQAPETIRNGKDCTFKSDVYSFGVVLHELLSGQLPYKGLMLEQVIFMVACNLINPDVQGVCSTSRCPPKLHAIVWTGSVECANRRARLHMPHHKQTRADQRLLFMYMAQPSGATARKKRETCCLLALTATVTPGPRSKRLPQRSKA